MTLLATLLTQHRLSSDQISEMRSGKEGDVIKKEILSGMGFGGGGDLEREKIFCIGGALHTSTSSCLVVYNLRNGSRLQRLWILVIVSGAKESYCS